MKKDRDRADDYIRNDQIHVAPTRRREPTEDPCVDLPDRLRLALLDVGLDRGEERGHSDTGEYQSSRGPGSPSGATHRVGREYADQSSDEGGERQGIDDPRR